MFNRRQTNIHGLIVDRISDLMSMNTMFSQPRVLWCLFKVVIMTNLGQRQKSA